MICSFSAGRAPPIRLNIFGTPPLAKAGQRTARLLRQLPNGHASISPWLAAHKNKEKCDICNRKMTGHHFPDYRIFMGYRLSKQALQMGRSPTID